VRPTHLELEGFASFRDPVEVDFTDADLFVLSGPTGAGKSSIVDAVTFALYGTVPRYDDRRMVAPLISQGRAEARVRLDFTVGPRTYTAVRVVRRTKTGATTKEARLERWRTADGTDTVTLAGTADELTQQVEQLLGLRFEHFTACIVLPQGAFQQFLHSRPRERQDLLVQLLDLDVYRRVGAAARERATARQQAVDLHRRRLDGELADATEDAVKAAAARVEQLDGLVTDLDDAQPRLDDIRQQGTRLREAATTARRRAEVLAGVAVPDGIDDLSARLQEARRVVGDADAALERAAAAAEAAAAAREEAGDVGPRQRQLDRLAERDRLRQQLAAADRAVTDADAALAAAGTDEQAARVAVDAARAGLEDAQQHDLVAALVADHQPGDPCPVCDHPLASVPDTDDGTALAHARERLRAAEQDLADATRGHQQAATRHTRATTERDGLEQRVAELDRHVADAVEAGLPDRVEALREAIDRLGELDGAVASARRDEQAARRADREAREALSQAEDAVTRAWGTFDQTWQAVADLGPPPTQREDVAAAWATLAAWATRRQPELLEEARQAEAEVEETADRWKREVARLREACRDHDVAVGVLADRLAEAERLRTELATAQHEQRLAHDLGLHLKSSNFEKWLLNRALQRLVVGATRMLHDLSDGAYSLTLDDGGGFAVVDHRNADEVRSARTLSGGETFLASLALALALSEHVADLAAQGAARLESLILDEGFGTLDTETLDVVATALEELGSRGRMVGVITHVGALAQRLPVRFEVRKEAGTSSVARVSA
jgi:exonuclease SbcC